MALKLFPIPFPLLAPPPDPRPTQGASSPHRRPTTEVHFSRWYNANAEKFELRRRAQEEIEADIRRRRRFDAITNIVDKFDSYAETASAETFKSIGTPSDPSKPSIPGRKSKYSKPETRIAKLPRPKVKERAIIDRKAEIKISEDGLSYVVDGAPFEFKYSYTETPKVKPLKLREAPFAPFGPATMRRPWTGRVPHPAGKNKLRDFDSFVSPGPFPPGSGPRYVKTREEILGEPLTVEEIEELINGCLKSTRQLNMGRDGFTHNMLDNIHAHWKRRRVCKIKCRGVCTVDMCSVCQQLEEKTGGKIIYRKGGVLYLFRGRNYNYRFRHHFPLMWWRPIMPVYPRLIQRAPEGLTLEEATEMRRKGRKLLPICKLAKNGVYNNLLEHVREAFEECDLVRINCQGLNGSDYHKIGAKLKELVPCVLISFEHEHILMWRGRNWKPSFSKSVNECRKDNELGIYGATSTGPFLENQETEMLSAKSLSISALDVNTQSLHSEEQAKDLSPEATDDSYVAIDAHSLKSANKLEQAKGSSTFGLTSTEPSLERQDEMRLVGDTRLSTLNLDSSSLGTEKQGKDLSFVETEELYASIDAFPTPEEICEIKTALNNTGSAVNKCEGIDRVSINGTLSIDGDNVEMLATTLVKPYTSRNVGTTEELQDVSEGSEDLNETAKLCVPQTDEVLRLWKQAVEEGIAVVLANADLDADTIYQKAIAFDQSAPPGPVFRHQPKPAIVQKHEQQESGDLEITKVMDVFEKGDGQRKGSEHRKTEELDKHIIDAMPQGSLGVDKLAKLLA